MRHFQVLKNTLEPNNVDTLLDANEHGTFLESLGIYRCKIVLGGGLKGW